MKRYGRVLRTIGGDKNAEWKLIDHDQDTIKIQLVRDKDHYLLDKDRYILVDKGAFRLFANAFSEELSR